MITIQYDDAIGKNVWKIQAKIIAVIIPPKNPSIVLLGDISGQSFTFPILRPTKIGTGICCPNYNEGI